MNEVTTITPELDKVIVAELAEGTPVIVEAQPVVDADNTEVSSAS